MEHIPQEITEVYNGKYVHTYELKFADGRKYEVASRNNMDKFMTNPECDAVDIIAFSEDFSKICIIKEYRIPVGDYIYAFPAGLRDSGESITRTAERELYEETGLFVSKQIKTLLPSYQSAGFSDEKLATVICTAIGEVTNLNQTKDEDIIPMWINKEEAIKLLTTEKFSGRCQIFLTLWSNPSLGGNF